MDFLIVHRHFKLREAVEPCFGFAPVVALQPIVAKFTHIGHVGAIGPAVAAFGNLRHLVPFVSRDLGGDHIKGQLRNVDFKGHRRGHEGSSGEACSGWAALCQSPRALQ